MRYNIGSKPIVITSFEDNKVTLSNNQILTKSFILSDEGLTINLKIETNIEDFLADTNNYQFLESFKGKKEIFILGCGKEFIIPFFGIKSYINSLGFKLEWMPTKSAYHTFNLLLEDYRSCFGLFINEIDKIKN
ncbi:DUF498-domain-containing protein [Candidatus Hepatincolaceae symbiont of Richtersius coronifer]